MEENGFGKTIINEAVESYKKVMNTLLNETDPYSPDILNKIHLRLINTYLEALRETFNTNEYNGSLGEDLETAFNDFKEMNEFHIEELHRNASQTIHKLKMKYCGDMEDLLDENPDGMEEQVLKKAHEETVKEVRNLLGKELQNKVRVNEPVEPHWECLKFHTEKYFRSIEDANQENLEKFSNLKKKVVGTEKKVENHTKPVKTPEVKPFGESSSIDENAQTKTPTSRITNSLTSSSGVFKYKAPNLLQNDKNIENSTNFKPKEVLTATKVSQLKPTIQIKPNTMNPSQLEESYSGNKNLPKPPAYKPILPTDISKYLTPESTKKDEKIQTKNTPQDKPSIANTQVNLNIPSQYNSTRNNSQTTSQLSKSKSELPKPRQRNQYENVSVSYTVAAQSKPIQIKTMPLSPTSAPLKKSKSVTTPSRFENLNTASNQPSSVFSGGGVTVAASHSDFFSFSSSTSTSTPASSASKAQLPPLLISLTPHEVSIGIRQHDQFTTLVNEFGDYFTPMQIAYTKLDTFLYGSKASEERRDSLKHFWSLEECFMWGKNPWSSSLIINGRLRLLRGEMVVGYILKKLKLSAERQLEGRFCWATLIAVPNWFEFVDRCLVEDAARAAGFTSVKLVNQLSAIALRHVGHVKRKGVGNPSNFLILQKYQNFIYAAAYGADSTMERVYLLGHCMKKYKKNRGTDRQRFLTWSSKTRDNNEREMNRRKELIQFVLEYVSQIGNSIEVAVRNDLADRSWCLHPHFVVSDSEEWIEMMQDVVKGEIITKDVNDVMIGLAHLARRPTSVDVDGKPIINDGKTLVATAAHEKNNFSRGQVDEIARVISEMEISSDQA